MLYDAVGRANIAFLYFSFTVWFKQITSQQIGKWNFIIKTYTHFYVMYIKKIITIEKHNIYGQHVFTQQDTRFEILLRPFSARPLKIVNDYELATYLLFNSLPVMNKTN